MARPKKDKLIDSPEIGEDLEVRSDESATEIVIEEPKTPTVVPLPFTNPTFTPPPPADNGKTLPEKLVAYLKGRSDFIKINDFYRIELKQSAAKQEVNKSIRAELQKLIDDGVIEVKTDAYKKLGNSFYDGNKPETQFKTVLNVIIEAKLA